MIYSRIASKWGQLIACIDSEDCLVGLWFENQKYFPQIPKEAVWLNCHDPNTTGTLRALQEQLTAYESGSLRHFSLKLAPQGTAFRKLIWDLLLEVPFGETLTYGELGRLAAIRLDRESMSAQAVGGAVGHNPISIVIPCHRIIGASGSLTGYAGGLDKKSALLSHEDLSNPTS